MQIIIPMTGLGSRFKNAGYKELKPLILVEGKPIIEHVIKLYPGEDDFLFIVRKEHIETTPIIDVLKKLCPKGKIKIIKGHKLGPVYAVTQVFDQISDSKPTILNYCDFYMNWDYLDFKTFTIQSGCDGAIPCYTGFHPHLLHKNNLYASCKVNNKLELLEIKEKFSFESDKSKAYHSGGNYYFKSGETLKTYCNKLITNKESLNGEYYASLVYNNMCKDGLKTLVYDKINHFCQWGTPFDLEEYNYWSQIFKVTKS